MSVYIKGMEMPKKGTCKTITIFDDGAVVKGNGSEKLGIAIHVPEHGRLGDLDAAVEKLKRLREYHSDDSQSAVFIAHGISQCIEVLTGKEAPAIIPTSGKEEQP